jgi:NitT/TauT family transport system substrate-binding protein
VKFFKFMSSLLMLFALIASSCGSDSDSSGSTSYSNQGTEGCKDAAVTSVKDRSPGRNVARCESGYPKAQPLPEKTKVSVVTKWKAEFVSPILTGIEFGEFAAENLEIEFVELGFSDAIAQLDSCNLDFGVAGTEAALHNAINNDVDIKMILGNYYPPDAGDLSVDQTGLWARRDAFSNPDNPDIGDLKGQKIASAVGLGSVISYPIGAALEPSGVSLLDMTVEKIGSSDMVLALENNAVQAAWLLDPYWVAAANNPDLVLVATQTPGEALGGIYVGPCLRDPKRDRDVGLAFARAYIRSINTYLDGAYQSNPDVIAALVNQSGYPETAFTATGELTFDWEMKEGTSRDAQGFYIEFESVDYTEPISEDRVYDRSLYLDAVGKG